MTEPSSRSSRTFGGHPLQAIRALDYTILFARDLPAMRKFYADVMRFDVYHEIADNWIEFRVGANVLALAKPGLIVPDRPPRRRRQRAARLPRTQGGSRRRRSRTARRRRHYSLAGDRSALGPSDNVLSRSGR